MLAISGLSFCAWRIGRNMKLLHKHTVKRNHVELDKDKMKTMAQELKDKSYTWERIMIYLGLRPIEKVGIGNV